MVATGKGVNCAFVVDHAERPRRKLLIKFGSGGAHSPSWTTNKLISVHNT